MNRHQIATGLTALALFAVVGCGESNEAPTGATGESGDTATEEEVTAAFEQWRYKRAARVGDTEVAITVDNVSCTIDSPGAATCSEEVTYDSIYLGKTVETGVWNITYDEATGEMISASSLGNGASNDGAAPGGIPS